MVERVVESLAQLIDALDAAPDDDAREAIYASAALDDLPAIEIREPAIGRPCGKWLALRSSAGPPGVELPSWEDARKRAFGEFEFTSAADAYQLLMAGPPFQREWMIRALQNAMLIATKRRHGGFLVMRIAIAWVVAMLACRRGREIRKVYEGYKFGDVELKPPIFELVEALSDAVDLIEHPALVRYARRAWRNVRFPTTPDLPPPCPHRGEQPDVEVLLERVRSAGLTQIAASLIKAPTPREPGDAAFIERCWAAVHAGERAVDVDGESVTDAIEEWLTNCVVGDRTGVAVVAARSLYHAGRISASRAMSVLLFDLRAADLPVFLAGFRDEHGQPVEYLTEIRRICDRLDGAAADAAFWLLTPSKIANGRERFHDSVEHLDAVIEAMADAPVEMRKGIERIRQAKAESPKNQAVDAKVRRWFDAIRAHIAALRTDEALDRPAFEVATDRLARPLRSDDDLRRRALPVLHHQASIVRLVAVGAFLRIEQDPEELQLLRFRLAQEIGQVNLPGLVPLRIDLLKQVLAGRRVRDIKIGEVFRLLGRAYVRLSRLADGVATFEDFLLEARDQRDDGMIAEAICELIPARVAYARQQGIHGHDTDEWLELLGEARELATSARQQADVEVAILATLSEGRHKKDVKAVRSAMIDSLKALHREMDDDDRVRISSGIATAINEDHRSEEAVEWIHEALDLLPVNEHSWAPAPLLCELGLAHARLGEYDRAMLSFERASMAASECGDDLQIMHIEATNENYASWVGGVKPQRFQFVRRARQAAERIGHFQQVVHHGLREARCAYEDWQAAPALRAVGLALPLMRENARFDDYYEQYQSRLDRFDLSDPPAPVSPPEYTPPAASRISRYKLDELIEQTTRDFEGEPEEVCEMLAAFLIRACTECQLEPGVLLAIKLLRTCLNLRDGEQLERLSSLAFDCLDVLFAICHFTDAIMEAIADATRAHFAHRFGGGDIATEDDALVALARIGRFVGFREQQSAMRFQQPSGVGSLMWEQWLLGHHIKDAAMVFHALADIQALAPEFLTEMPHLGPLAELLGEDATAVGVVPLDAERFACFVAKAGEKGLRGAVWTACFPNPPLIGDDPSDREIAALNRWTEEILRQVRRKVGFSGDVVWCAKGPASMASPWQVFPEEVTQIRCIASPAVAPVVRRATRPRSTLIVHADPGPGAGDFGSPELKWLRPLVRAARGGRTEVLAARGAVHGGKLPWFGGHVIQRAPSAESLLTRQRQHDLIVVIAHGRLEGEDAEIALIDDLGLPTKIAAAQIAATPGLLGGASVILLSCRTGVAGQRLHRPAGFAGACLAAGAVEVIAPLRAVAIDVAVEIGAFITQAYCEGRRLSEALGEFMRSRRAGCGSDGGFATFVCWAG